VARRIQETYAGETARRYGRSWTPEEYMLGFLADCYDVDLEAACTKTMQDIADHVESLESISPSTGRA
jgi:hypothetical protein